MGEDLLMLELLHNKMANGKWKGLVDARGLLN